MLILARHGTTDLTEAHVLLGRGDPPLSSLGREQARALAGWVTSKAVVRIQSSPLRRARETAEIVAAQLGLTLEVTPSLAERDYGPFEGLPRDALLSRRAAMGLDNADPTQDWRGCPSVESDDEVWSRFTDHAAQHGAFDASPSDASLLVTHAGLIDVVFRRTFGIRDSRRRCIKVRPASAIAWLSSGSGLELAELWVNPLSV